MSNQEQVVWTLVIVSHASNDRMSIKGIIKHTPDFAGCTTAARSNQLLLTLQKERVLLLQVVWRLVCHHKCCCLPVQA